MTRVFTLKSSLHDEKAVEASTASFLSSIGLSVNDIQNDYSTYGSGGLDLVFVRTGGTEGIFLSLLPSLLERSASPFYLLTSGASNSLAASMEILSYLRQKGLKGEILHGSPSRIKRRITALEAVEAARATLTGMVLGVVGKPSDWLISSSFDRDEVESRLGIRLVDIPMDEVLEAYDKSESSLTDAAIAVGTAAYEAPKSVQEYLPGAHRIYEALRKIISSYGLNGFTIRCFDLLTAVRNTGCLALAKLNSEGFIAGCEGDVPAMLSMAVAKAFTKVSGFQANPSSIDPDTGEITFAHCTIPLDMVTRMSFDTHFESGIGVGIKGYFQEGPVTVLKLSGDLRRVFAEEGELIRNQSSPNLCRTQIVVKLDSPEAAASLLTDPVGNHHVIVPGRLAEAFKAIL